MSGISIETFSSNMPKIVPRLFANTGDFRFLDKTGELVHCSLPAGPRGYRVVAVSSTGHGASFDERDRTSLTLPLSGTARVSVDDDRVAVRPGELFMIAPSQRRSVLQPDEAPEARYRSFTVVAPKGEEFDRFGAEPWRLRSRYPGLSRLRQLIELAFEINGGETPPTASTIASLEALVDDLFRAAVIPDGGFLTDSIEQCGHETLVVRAREFMRENLSRPLSINDIARAVEVNIRTLQSAFSRHAGTSPRRALNDVRIEEMRRLLLDPSPGRSVTSAAMDAGLFHLGRSSGAYRERYGELPSATLRRAQGGCLARKRR